MNRGSAIINFENAIMKHEGASSASSKNLVDLKVISVPVSCKKLFLQKKCIFLRNLFLNLTSLVFQRNFIQRSGFAQVSGLITLETFVILLVRNYFIGTQ